MTRHDLVYDDRYPRFCLDCGGYRWTLEPHYVTNPNSACQCADPTRRLTRLEKRRPQR